MQLDWDYKNRTVDISMTDYVKEALTSFQHPQPKQPIHAPSKYIPPDYGIKKQREHLDKGRPMDEKYGVCSIYFVIALG